MSGIKLVPEGGGETIIVPDESTVIGRGAFLKVTDKRVSRSHALLEVLDGKLHLTPTHTNPCFLRRGGKGLQEVLQRDLRQILDEGDVFGLLPDQLFYTVTYGDVPVNGVKSNGEGKDTVKKESKTQPPAKKKAVRKDETGEEMADEEDVDEQAEKAHIISVIRADGKNMALPLTKKRTLPAWMIRLSKAGAPVIKKKTAPAKVETSFKQAAPRKSASKQRNSDDDFIEDDDDDYEDERPSKQKSTKSPRAAAKRKRNVNDFIDDDDLDEEEDERETRRRRKAASDDDYKMDSEEENHRRSKGKRNRRSPSDDDFDSEEERPKRRKVKKQQRKHLSDEDDDMSGQKGKRKGMRSRQEFDTDSSVSRRRPKRAATEKRGSYVDDFMVGDDFDESDELPAKPDSDSDFQLEGNDDGDSGSDWEKGRGSQKSRKGTGRGTPRKGRKRKSRRGSESEEDDLAGSDDEYVPRPSKRRGATSKRSRRPADSEEEEEEEEEEAAEKGAKKSSSKSPTKKAKNPCYYGAKCYRRNPDHFKQFSHPGDSEEEEEESGNEKGSASKGRQVAEKMQPKPQPRKAVKKKKSEDEEDDDGLPNTYDYNDSFIDDGSLRFSQTQHSEDGSDREDIARLKTETKAFVKSKRD